MLLKTSNLQILKKKKKTNNKFSLNSNFKFQIPSYTIWNLEFSFLKFFKVPLSTEFFFYLRLPQRLLLERAGAISLLHSHRTQNLL